MLTMTDSAVSAIRGLTSQPELPVETGLRIVAHGDGMPSFQVTLAEGAAVLDSKSLDAEVNEQGQVSFSLSERAAS